MDHSFVSGSLHLGAPCGAGGSPLDEEPANLLDLLRKAIARVLRQDRANARFQAERKEAYDTAVRQVYPDGPPEGLTQAEIIPILLGEGALSFPSSHRGAEIYIETQPIPEDTLSDEQIDALFQAILDGWLLATDRVVQESRRLTFMCTEDGSVLSDYHIGERYLGDKIAKMLAAQHTGRTAKATELFQDFAREVIAALRRGRIPVWANIPGQLGFKSEFYTLPLVARTADELRCNSVLASGANRVDLTPRFLGPTEGSHAWKERLGLLVKQVFVEGRILQINAETGDLESIEAPHNGNRVCYILLSDVLPKKMGHPRITPEARLAYQCAAQLLGTFPAVEHNAEESERLMEEVNKQITVANNAACAAVAGW